MAMAHIQTRAAVWTWRIAKGRSCSFRKSYSVYSVTSSDNVLGSSSTFLFQELVGTLNHQLQKNHRNLPFLINTITNIIDKRPDLAAELLTFSVTETTGAHLENDTK